MWLSPWSEEWHIWDLLPQREFKACGFHQSLKLIISFCMTVVDKVFDFLCPWLLCYLTASIHLHPNSFQPFWFIWLLPSKPRLSLFLLLITLTNLWLAHKQLIRWVLPLTNFQRREAGWWVHTVLRHMGDMARMHPFCCYFYGFKMVKLQF